MTGSDSPAILALPVGIAAAGARTETDSLGEVEVPADRYWGAQTQRALVQLDIGEELMPREVWRAYGVVKKAAALANAESGRLPRWMGELIARVADEVAEGRLDEHFPLRVWQSGSGTQTNMNVNEVISNRCIQLTGGVLGSKRPVHPNDHVNLGQSTNDTFPTAMHVATVRLLREHLLPRLDALRDAIAARAAAWSGVVKIGRTHLQDATPLTVGQEWSGYAAQLEDARAAVAREMAGLYRLAAGGTAVGTGLGAPAGFGEEVAARIAELTGDPFVTAPNKFAAQASLDDMVRASASLRGVAVPLFKIANDLRWLGSGPHAGLHELRLPTNEPGSSIMPGKVNPTQAEAMLMVCIEVIASDTAVAVAGAEGNFELNAFRPLVIRNVLRSIRLLGDACDHFRRLLVEGAALDEKRLRSYVERSLMLVTALSPAIGYDAAARIAHLAAREDIPLREAALRSGVSAELFDTLTAPEKLTRPGGTGASG